MPKPIIPEKFVQGLSDKALNAQIKRYSKRANSRIERLKREGLWYNSASIQRKWEAVTHTAPIGTNSGRFSRSVSGNRETREEQLKQLIRFLNAKTTVKDVKNEIKTFKAKITAYTGNAPSDDLLGAINRLMGRYMGEFKRFGISSEQAYHIITELVYGKGEQGAEDSILHAIRTAQSNDDFFQRLTENYTYY